MSSDTDASDLVAVFSDLYTGEYCNIATSGVFSAMSAHPQLDLSLGLAAALFIYEVLITLDREVACFWTSKQSKSGARLLFLANKWISVIVSAMAFAQMANLSSDKGFTQYGYNLQGFLFPPFGCTVIDDTTESLQTKCVLLYISRIPLIVADTLLICITWSKLISREALRGIGQSKRLSLSDVLLRDGTIYFVVLFVMNVLHFSLSLAALAIGADGASNVSIFTAPITAILISRFLLQLQEADQQVVRVDFDDPLHSSRDPYDDVPSFISSLGAFINPDLASANDDAHLDMHTSSHSDGEEEGGTHPSEPQATASSSASV
ncbi:hypothetical protein L227DRAFT_658258 [Lentinus tigrinus ALCF2SS1-6]|uniref:DUF6533 domain-containing protein n=1 Tax=Lentinus tigrinus ALCF2SS1-6 TaxID=1328759 RepID=A0A5C2RP15_9APHY|nr:hypothetical protein L227DRAFT_658258 [Lentinus tigrinus ALCF2SS1-6]